MAKNRMIFFRASAEHIALVIAQPKRKRPGKSREKAGNEARQLPKPTHHAPCSVGKVQEMAARLERGEALWHPDDFTPTDPVMIERYVFSGRKAASFTVAELLASSPRNRE